MSYSASATSTASAAALKILNRPRQDPLQHTKAFMVETVECIGASILDLLDLVVAVL